jgi:transmembrane sensor
VDIDQRLDAIYGRIRERITPPVRISWHRIAAAAAVLAFVGTGVVFLTRHREVHPLQASITAPVIKPGKNQAVLRLADGTVISLDDATAGEVANQSGVRITKAEDGQLVYQDVNNSEEVLYNAIEAPASGQWQVVLPDRSHVWLNSKSVLKYPTRFKGNERKVELTGEAYFEIASDQSKPFRVVSKGQTVEVLGTQFNMMSYPDEPAEKTTLFEGAVRVNKTVLKPGEQLQVNGAGMQLNQHPDLEEVIAWKNGYFKFNGRLEDIMSKISRWYDVEIVYVNKPNPGYTFEGEISRNKNLNEILNIMEYTGKVHFSVTDRKIEVRN